MRSRRCVTPIPGIPILLATALVVLPTCSARQVSENHHQISERQLLNEAWHAARARLHAMCPEIPRSLEDIERAMSRPDDNGCSLRLLKASNAPTPDDWHWYWLPPYQLIISVHDEELRKRVTPKLYEKYMLALTRYLGEKADNGEITMGQLKDTVNVGWHWLSGKMQEERLLLEEAVRSAEAPDPAMWNTMNVVASGLGFVATAALLASGQASAYPAAPTNCYALPNGSNYSIQCY